MNRRRVSPTRRRAPRGGPISYRGMARSMRLDQRHDVALGILEPRRLGVARRGNAVARLDLGCVVFLELHAAALELGNLALDVLDLPKRLACPRAAGVGRGVHEAGRVAAELVNDAPFSFFLG